MSFRTVVNRVAGIGRASRPGRLVDIDFAGHCVTGLNFAGTSKAGHMSWTGSVSDGPVKLYETSGPSSAELVSRLSRDECSLDTEARFT